MPLFSMDEAVAAVERARRDSYLEGERRHPQLSAKVRTWLVKDPVFEGFRDGVDDVENVVELIRSRVTQEDLAGAELSDEVHGIGTPAEGAYRVARSLLAYESAAGDEAVLAFRSAVLDDMLLAPEGVAAWVDAQWHEAGPPYDAGILEYPSKGHVGIRSLPRSGHLTELRALSERLAASHGWQRGQATAFVLTDAVPLVPVLGVTTDPGTSTVTIRASAELSERTVAEAYSQARRKLTKGRRRLLPGQVWEVVGFVASRSARSWGELRLAWNREHRSDAHYGTDRAFAKAARSGLDRLGLRWESDES